jgi:hypothetical protein
MALTPAKTRRQDALTSMIAACRSAPVLLSGCMQPCCIARPRPWILPTSLQVQSTRWLSGIPSAASVFRMRQPTLACTLCPCSVRLRIAGPMMVLYR